jgi:hypothetical protein
MRNHGHGILVVPTLLTLLAGTGCATDMNHVSPEVRTAVEAKFPDAAVKEVEQESCCLYEIELAHKDVDHELKVHRNGTIIEIETEIEASALPQPVADTMAKKLKDHKPDEIERVERLGRQTLTGAEAMTETEVYYEIEWTVSGFEKEIKVNADGTLR